MIIVESGFRGRMDTETLGVLVNWSLVMMVFLLVKVWLVRHSLLLGDRMLRL